MLVSDLSKSIVEAVKNWDEVTVNPHRFGGQEFRWGRVEIGHVHQQGIVDIPFPSRIREQIVGAGLANPHHILPDSGWITLPLRSERDVERALDLLGLSLDLKRARRTKDLEIEARLEHALSNLGLRI